MDLAITDQALVNMKSFWVTNNQSASIPVVWDALKATMHGSFAAAIGQACKASQSKLVDAQGELQEAGATYFASPDPETMLSSDIRPESWT